MKNDNVIKETENGYYYEGYLGNTAWKGKKSDTFLYGSELSKAIRQDLKENGITGISVKCDTYSGGQSLTITIKAKPSDYVSKEEFKKRYTEGDVMRGRDVICKASDYNEKYNDFEKIQTISVNEFGILPQAEKEKILNYHQDIMYITNRNEKHNYISHMNDYDYKIYTNEMRQKLEKIQGIVSQYNHKDNNGMADYFDNNFYVDYTVKPSEPYLTKKEIENKIWSENIGIDFENEPLNFMEDHCCDFYDQTDCFLETYKKYNEGVVDGKIGQFEFQVQYKGPTIDMIEEYLEDILKNDNNFCNLDNYDKEEIIHNFAKSMFDKMEEDAEKRLNEQRKEMTENGDLDDFINCFESDITNTEYHEQDGHDEI